ncbi:MAG: YgeY family selenium metabolism-linked hydrolase [Candidatus Muiribacterium halophilum]|uniref:YgeY family selenium metabolism-linked hydrolase n=1 Tax=Muiribacterium halophilum TaxID=2053465 RepID=A0A2N5ZAW3_MUIH1|nr:MAG: YgeY family selenium metabolism-linked hydrolase [Candidatus Muirbacterium halophilum]
MKEKVLERVEHYRDEIIGLVQKMIQTKSYSKQEEDQVKLLVKTMQNLGYDEAFTDALGNAIGKIGNGDKVIFYDGHIDTVEVVDPANWQYPPFDAEIHDNKIYGRGTVDEKSGVACMIYAGKIMKELGLLDGYTLYVIGSVMEEDCDGYCHIHIHDHEKIEADYAVLAEPTNMDVYRGHRGRMEMIVKVKGKAAHGAHCDRGDNAIYKMASLVKEIEELHKRLKVDDFLGKGSITISKIESTAPSQCSVSDSCTIYLDRRLTVGETKESAVQEIKDLPSYEKIGAKVEVLEYDQKAWTGFRARQEAYFPTWVLPEKHELVQAAKKAADMFNKKETKISRWVFSTNGVATMGRYNIPTIGFAPGREELAHSIEEYVEIDELITATQIYAMIPSLLKEQGE